MNEKLKGFLGKQWNEPRRFFGWLTLFSLVGLAVGLLANQNYHQQTPPEWLRKIALSAMAILIAYLVLGFVCMVLAWIPPLRRLLTWPLQRRFYALACLVTLVALFYAEENWRGKHAWDSYRREWEAKGERFDFASIIPPPVPDDQNFALTPIVYSTYAGWLDKSGHRINPVNTNVVDRLDINIYRGSDYGDSNLVLGSWQKATFTDLKPWQEYYRHPKADPKNPAAVVTNEFPTSLQPQTPAADVLLALSKYDAAIEELREAAQLPDSRYPLEYHTDEPFAIVLPHLSKIKKVAITLRLRASAELQAGQPETALADVRLALRWNDSIRNEPFLIDHLVRVAVQAILTQPIWEGLAGKEWSDAQIIEVQAALAKLDFLADFHQSMRSECAASIAAIDYLRRAKNVNTWVDWTGNGSGNHSSTSSLELLNAIGFFLIPDGWFCQTKLTVAQMHQRWGLPMVDLPARRVLPSKNKQLADEANAALKVNSFKNILVRLIYPALEKAAKKFAFAQAQLDLAQTACALERYRLAHGEYPATLDALAPQFIAQVRHDIINGQPLHYLRIDGGQFILYSVGWNEKDDGGKVVLAANSDTQRVDTDQGDWVWKYPAK